MKFVMCRHGATEAGFVTVSLNRGSTVLVVKEIQALIYRNCGEYYLSEAATPKLLSKANAAVASGAEVEILRYAA